MKANLKKSTVLIVRCQRFSIDEKNLEMSLSGAQLFFASLSLSSAHFEAMSGELELSSCFGELVSTLLFGNVVS